MGLISFQRGIYCIRQMGTIVAWPWGLWPFIRMLSSEARQLLHYQGGNILHLHKCHLVRFPISGQICLSQNIVLLLWNKLIEFLFILLFFHVITCLLTCIHVDMHAQNCSLTHSLSHCILPLRLVTIVFNFHSCVQYCTVKRPSYANAFYGFEVKITEMIWKVLSCCCIR